MRRLASAILLVFRLTGPARAEDAVGNAGIRSVDVPTASLAPLESALDRAISVHAPAARGKTATLSALAADPEISGRRAEARRAADAGANAMRQLELEKAQEEFDRSAALFMAAHGDRLEPAEVARIYTTRAKVAQMMRAPGTVKAEFVRAVPLHATKQLDPATFPPDSVALFAQALAEAAKAPLQPPATKPLEDIARRTSLRWIVAGEARANAGGGHRIALAIADAAGASRTTELIAPPGDAADAFDAAIAQLFADAGVPSRETGVPGGGMDGATSGGTSPAGTVAMGTPRPVPTQALPRPTPPPVPRRQAGTPWHRQWYVVAGVAVLAVGAGAVVASTTTGEKRSSSHDPPASGVTLVIEKP